MPVIKRPEEVIEDFIKTIEMIKKKREEAEEKLRKRRKSLSKKKKGLKITSNQ